MVNYYHILGLETGANMEAVKIAFRRLAKLYHPDMNPEDKNRFEIILKAYETLSDQSLRKTYDYKLNYFETTQKYVSEKKTATTKTWSFDEKELKRRQYYNEYIKKHAKQASEYAAETESAKPYNEFKYILFATPLAVILFLLIMNVASRDRAEVINSNLLQTKKDTLYTKPKP
ncbi:MAG: J domain-containing protein [Bacteroidetes bacterium]|nr:J domain-containing protein [Bacteroidota bacterium]